jgi:ABC-type dipeptide/oligopeptide/nickel transport system permease component
LFYGAYTRLDSYFADTDLQATGTPGAGELKLLEPLRAQLDPAVFGPMVTQPSTNPPGSLRANLLKARTLLAQAGWTYRDGALRNAQGEPFRFEILDDSGAAMEGIVTAYQRNLAKLGIDARFRTADYALLQKRLDAFDYDMTTVRLPGVQVPGAEQYSRYASKFADEPGSDNLIGLKSPAVDALLHALGTAQTRDELLDATHALDRVLMHGYYAVPQWYSTTHRIAYKRRSATRRRCRCTIPPRAGSCRRGGRSPTAEACLPFVQPSLSITSRRPMWSYILKRLLLMIPTLVGVLTLTFAVIQFVPGGPVEQAVQELRKGATGEGAVPFGMRAHTGVDAQQLAQIKALYGFDKPPLERYWLMLKRFARFDLGDSYFRHQSVWSLIVQKLPVSISLGLWTFFLTYLISVPLGIAKAVRNGSPFDVATSLVVLVGYAIPGFVLGVLLLVLFGGGTFWQCFRCAASRRTTAQLSLLGKVLDYLWHIALPITASVSAASRSSRCSRRTRSSTRSASSTC